MKVIATELPEVLILEPKLFGDQRGFFLETFSCDATQRHGISRPFVQDNCPAPAMACCGACICKIRRRRESLSASCAGGCWMLRSTFASAVPTFGRHVAVELSEDNRRQLWVPRGFAHGFAVLSETADFFYKCDDLYSPKDEISVRWDDPAIGINWGWRSRPLVGTGCGRAAVGRSEESLPIYGADLMRIFLTGTERAGGWRACFRSCNDSVLCMTAEARRVRSSPSLRRLADCARRLRPDLIVNPAAYTAVDRAEDERSLRF